MALALKKAHAREVESGRPRFAFFYLAGFAIQIALSFGLSPSFP